MAIALSGGPNAYYSFAASTRNVMVNSIVPVLVRCGWKLSSTIAGGYELAATSPQLALSLSVKVWDPGSGSQILLQFVGSTAGYVHALNVATRYQIVANSCQFFISQPGVPATGNGSTCCGGIPFVFNQPGGRDPNCGDVGSNGAAVTECWWSMGDYEGGPFVGAATPRQNLWQGGFGGTTPNEGCINGNYAAGGGAGASCILSLTPSTLSSSTQFADDSPLITEPMIAWGDTSSGDIRVRGQVWDAMVVTEARALDDTTTVFANASLDPTYNWMNFTDSFAPGSLYLITGTSLSRPVKKTYVY